MAYTKQGFIDLKTVLSADHLIKIEEAIIGLEENVADLLYEEIKIISFSNNWNNVELGSVINDVTLSFSFNKTPTKVVLDDIEIPVSSTNYTLSNQNITENKTYMLKATDERNNTVISNSKITFLNRIYWGTANTPDIINSSFILGLNGNNPLSSSKARTFTVNATNEEYIWYCIPSRLGQCTFKVGGFDGGFNLADTIKFTNTSGHEEEYHVYRSANQNLGSTTVEVK